MFLTNSLYNIILENQFFCCFFFRIIISFTLDSKKIISSKKTEAFKKYDRSRHASLKALTRSFSGVVLTPESKFVH